MLSAVEELVDLVMFPRSARVSAITVLQQVVHINLADAHDSLNST